MAVLFQIFEETSYDFAFLPLALRVSFYLIFSPEVAMCFLFGWFFWFCFVFAFE
jgi:hypothetical protein